MRPVREAFEGLAAGTVLRFRLLANPTRKIQAPRPDGTRPRNGARVPLRGDEERIAWLRRKANEGGFEIERVSTGTTPDAVQSTGGRRVRGRKATADRRHQVELEGVLFDGRLRVVDPAAFLATMERGIGSGKAYGFGLLSIAPK